MFGLEQKKGDNKDEGNNFDLEIKLKGPNSAAELADLKKTISSRKEELQKVLREGSDKEAFGKAEVLLQGYLATEQVISKLTKK